MIYDVERTARFKKAYNRVKKRGANIAEIEYVINELRCGRKLAEKYQDHKLTGDLEGYRECHVRPDWLLVYKYKNEILTLLLFDTGTHSEIFGIL